VVRQGKALRVGSFFRTRAGLLLAGGEGVVPVVGRWPQAVDCGVEGDHPGRRRVAGAVGIEAAEDVVAAGNQPMQPGTWPIRVAV